MSVPNLEAHPIHLGLGATAVTEPEFTGSMDWYMGYAARHASDGADYPQAFPRKRPSRRY